MRVLRSTDASIHANLAWEEWLVDRFEHEGPVLFFHVNDPSVVVGKNQNPWRETNPVFLADDGVDLARRVSGGGTVYHDEGNLNYSLILSRHHYHQEDTFRSVIAALLELGIPAERMPANGLGVAGKKFSGHAFCYRGSAVMHHGTLLVDADLAQLRQAMKPALPDVQTRAIASRPASVMNLVEARPGLKVDDVMNALAAVFAPGVPVEEVAPPRADAAWQTLRTRNESWDWVLGYTPSFTWEVCADEAILVLLVDGGLVQDARLRRGEREQILLGLAGCRFTAAELVPALKTEMPAERGLAAALAGHSF
jgi:lipoate-protein ligase A